MPKHLGVVLLMTASLLHISAKTLHTEKLNVLQGQGFLMQIYNPLWDKECCKVYRDKVTYDLCRKGTRKVVTKNGEILERLHSSEMCRISVHGVKESSAGRWDIKNENGTFRKFFVTVNPATMGVECPSSPTENCELINLDNHEKRECGADVSDWKRYKCVFPVVGELRYREIFLPKAQVSKSVEISATEVTLNHVYDNYILECESPGGVPLDQCQAEHKRSHRAYNIRDGLQHAIYSSFKTNFTRGLCQFEVPKERAENEDSGRWEMTTTDIQGNTHTCHFNISPAPSKLKRADGPPTERPVMRKVQGSVVNQADFLEYPIKDCYLRDPQNNVRRSSGKCEFQLDTTGKYIFGFNAPSQWDVQQELHVYASGAIDGEMDLRAKSLQCKHIDGKPLVTCMFVSPSQNIINIPVATLTDKETGVCRMEVDAELEQGKWTCLIQDKVGSEILSTEIHV